MIPMSEQTREDMTSDFFLEGYMKHPVSKYFEYTWEDGTRINPTITLTQLAIDELSEFLSFENDISELKSS